MATRKSKTSKRENAKSNTRSKAKSNAGRQDLHIQSDHNEVSAMTAVYNRRLLDAYGFATAFWIVSDEAEAHECVALLGRREGTEIDDVQAWQVLPVDVKKSKQSTGKETDDPEAVARVGSWIYIFGSHFGSKSGPLDPERHFVARFNESLVKIKGDKLKLGMDVCRVPFALHRAVNDAIAQRDVALIPTGPNLRANYIRATIDKIESDGSKWRDRLHHSDRPINIEGVCFLPNGRLLVGLRYPVTAEGHPILDEIDGIDRLFEKHGEKHFGRLKATRLFVLKNVGTEDKPSGFRALIQRGHHIYAVTGDLDSDPDESQVLTDHPQGFDAPNAYHVFRIEDSADYGVVELEAETRHVFHDHDNVEAVAVMDDDTVWFAHDDEQIWLTKLPE